MEEQQAELALEPGPSEALPVIPDGSTGAETAEILAEHISEHLLRRQGPDGMDYVIRRMDQLDREMPVLVMSMARAIIMSRIQEEGFFSPPSGA